jgi:hypothetical protein
VVIEWKKGKEGGGQEGGKKISEENICDKIFFLKQ